MTNGFHLDLNRTSPVFLIKALDLRLRGYRHSAKSKAYWFWLYFVFVLSIAVLVLVIAFQIVFDERL